MNKLQEGKVNLICGDCGSEFKVQKKSLMVDGLVDVGLGSEATILRNNIPIAKISFNVIPLNDIDICPKCNIDYLLTLYKNIKEDEQKLMNGDFYIGLIR